MKRTRTSKGWMQEHVNDPYVKLAQKDGLRSRAAYKLIEIDDKDKLIRPGMTVIDLGSSPGSWSQVVQQRLKGQGRIIALDILPMAPIPSVEFIQGDFREDTVLHLLENSLANRRVDLVISDMAPNISGVSSMDQARASHLVELAITFCDTWLKPQGSFLVKVFHGADFVSLQSQIKARFETVVIRKPKASRDRSKEVYLLALKKL